MKPDDHVCLCYDVSLRKIVNYIRRERPPVATLISECLSAGTGCGWCVPFLRKLHRDVLAGKFDAMDGLDWDEYRERRADWKEAGKPGRDLDRFADEPPASTGEPTEDHTSP